MRRSRTLEIKDYKKRFRVYSFEPKAVVLRSIISNCMLSSEFRIFSRFELFRLTSKLKFPSTFRNRCLITGRLRAVVPYFKVSRIEFRRIAKLGKFMGVTKSSW